MSPLSHRDRRPWKQTRYTGRRQNVESELNKNLTDFFSAAELSGAHRAYCIYGHALKRNVSLKYSIIVLADKTNHRKVTCTFFTFQVLKKLGTYFYLSNSFGRYFYFYLSNFLASYLYFYLSTQTRYLLQHCHVQLEFGVHVQIFGEV